MRIKSIQVLGSGCTTCKKLFEATKKVAGQLGIDVEVEYITDMSKLLEMGVMTSPILAVNGKPVLNGGGKTEDDIREVLQAKNLEEDCATGGCGCGGKC